MRGKMQMSRFGLGRRTSEPMNDERTEGAQEINLSVRKIEQSVERRKGGMVGAASYFWPAAE